MDKDTILKNLKINYNNKNYSINDFIDKNLKNSNNDNHIININTDDDKYVLYKFQNIDNNIILKNFNNFSISCELFMVGSGSEKNNNIPINGGCGGGYYYNNNFILNNNTEYIFKVGKKGGEDTILNFNDLTITCKGGNSDFSGICSFNKSINNITNLKYMNDVNKHIIIYNFSKRSCGSMYLPDEIKYIDLFDNKTITPESIKDISGGGGGGCSSDGFNGSGTTIKQNITSINDPYISKGGEGGLGIKLSNFNNSNLNKLEKFISDKLIFGNGGYGGAYRLNIEDNPITNKPDLKFRNININTDIINKDNIDDNYTGCGGYGFSLINKEGFGDKYFSNILKESNSKNGVIYLLITIDFDEINIFNSNKLNLLKLKNKIFKNNENLYKDLLNNSDDLNNYDNKLLYYINKSFLTNIYNYNGEIIIKLFDNINYHVINKITYNRLDYYSIYKLAYVFLLLYKIFDKLYDYFYNYKKNNDDFELHFNSINHIELNFINNNDFNSDIIINNNILLINIKKLDTNIDLNFNNNNINDSNISINENTYNRFIDSFICNKIIINNNDDFNIDTSINIKTGKSIDLFDFINKTPNLSESEYIYNLNNDNFKNNISLLFLINKNDQQKTDISKQIYKFNYQHETIQIYQTYLYIKESEIIEYIYKSIQNVFKINYSDILNNLIYYKILYQNIFFNTLYIREYIFNSDLNNFDNLFNYINIIINDISNNLKTIDNTLNYDIDKENKEIINLNKNIIDNKTKINSQTINYKEKYEFSLKNNLYTNILYCIFFIKLIFIFYTIVNIEDYKTKLIYLFIIIIISVITLILLLYLYNSIDNIIEKFTSNNSILQKYINYSNIYNNVLNEYISNYLLFIYTINSNKLFDVFEKTKKEKEKKLKDELYLNTYNNNKIKNDENIIVYDFIYKYNFNLTLYYLLILSILFYIIYITYPPFYKIYITIFIIIIIIILVNFFIKIKKPTHILTSKKYWNDTKKIYTKL